MAELSNIGDVSEDVSPQPLQYDGRSSISCFNVLLTSVTLPAVDIFLHNLLIFSSHFHLLGVS